MIEQCLSTATAVLIAICSAIIEVSNPYRIPYAWIIRRAAKGLVATFVLSTAVLGLPTAFLMLTIPRFGPTIESFIAFGMGCACLIYTQVTPDAGEPTKRFRRLLLLRRWLPRYLQESVTLEERRAADEILETINPTAINFLFEELKVPIGSMLVKKGVPEIQKILETRELFIKHSLLMQYFRCLPDYREQLQEVEVQLRNPLKGWDGKERRRISPRRLRTAPLTEDRRVNTPFGRRKFDDPQVITNLEATALIC